MKSALIKNVLDLKHTRYVTYFAIVQGALATILVAAWFSDLIPVENKMPLAAFLAISSFLAYRVFLSRVQKLENTVFSL